MNRNIKIIFFGTDEFAKIVLDALKAAHFDVVQEVTSPVSSKKLELKEADLGVVAVYGKILTQKILDHFPHGVLNIHPSLLPKYRGPSPIRTAIANGDSQSGVTIIKLNSRMDEGDILASVPYQIPSHALHARVRDEMAALGVGLLLKCIPDWVEGKLPALPQNNKEATYTKLLTREDGKVDLGIDSAEMIYNKYRAFEGWPGIWTMHKGKRVKILNCRLIDGRLEILEVQPEGKKPMSMRDFTNGYGSLTA